MKQFILSFKNQASWHLPTQFWTAVIADYPREHRVLGEVIAAAVGQVVEVQEVLVVGKVPTLPLQRVALGSALCDMVLWGGQGLRGHQWTWQMLVKFYLVCKSHML